MFSIRSLLLLLVASSFLLTACPRRYVDTDGTYLKATPLTFNQRIEDGNGLNPKRGDKDDWKVFRAPKNGRVQVRVDFGDPFKGTQGLTSGRISVHSATASVLQEQVVESGKAHYTLTFKVKRDKRYFVHIQGTSGAGSYALKLTFKKKKKRCVGCTPGKQFCQSNQCMAADAYDPPPECEDPCGSREVCVRETMFGVGQCLPKRSKETCQTACSRIMEATPHYLRAKLFHDRPQAKSEIAAFRAEESELLEGCVRACSTKKLAVSCLAKARSTLEMDACSSSCPGGCPRGSTCNKRRRRCTKNPCAGVSCPSGQRCRGGKCVEKPVAGPACSPACKEDYKCNARKGVCEFALGPIKCRLTSVTPEGARTSFIINRGRAHKVSVGDRGTLSGVGKFKVIAVYGTRSKAMIKKPAPTVRANGGCVLRRNGGR